MTSSDLRLANAMITIVPTNALRVKSNDGAEDVFEISTANKGLKSHIGRAQKYNWATNKSKYNRRERTILAGPPPGCYN